jgi:two-component system, NarL family, sensor histidine kinase BarA
VTLAAELLPGDKLALRVADSGIGIAPEHLHRIFDVFYQVDGSTTREYGGAGLGLAIVKSFAEAHGGEVQVASTPGQGSTFSLILPVRQHPEPAVTPPAATPPV